MGTASTTKFIKNVAGQLTEETGLTTSAGAADAQRLPALNANGVLDATIVNSKVVSAGAADAGKVAALDGSGKLDTTVLPTGVGVDTAAVTASEALAAGDFVNIHSSTGAKARKADATIAGKEAHGFVLAAVAAAGQATVYFEGTNNQVTGQTPGRVYLQATAGLAGAAAPTGSGNVVQVVGFAISATAINFQSGTSITLA